MDRYGTAWSCCLRNSGSFIPAPPTRPGRATPAKPTPSSARCAARCHGTPTGLAARLEVIVELVVVDPVDKPVAVDIGVHLLLRVAALKVVVELVVVDA